MKSNLVFISPKSNSWMLRWLNFLRCTRNTSCQFDIKRTGWKYDINRIVIDQNNCQLFLQEISRFVQHLFYGNERLKGVKELSSKLAWRFWFSRQHWIICSPNCTEKTRNILWMIKWFRALLILHAWGLEYYKK